MQRTDMPKVDISVFEDCNLILFYVFLKAVLSIDDDLVIPCLTLSHAVTVWRSNQRALVGFSPRMIVYDIITGEYFKLMLIDCGLQSH